MVSHKDVCEAFYDGDKKEGTNMFTNGKTIYSWGHHFPIAHYIGDGTFLYNTDKYSASTSKHQCYVRRVIEDCNTIECNTTEIRNAVEGNPVVVTKTEEYKTVAECLERINNIYKAEGLKRCPIRKLKKELEQWEMIKRL